MADFEYTGNGTIRLKGCADHYEALRVLIPYAEGSVVYDCGRARKGFVEKVAIRKVQINVNEATFGQPVVQYYDTTNRLWFEEDLCTHENAISLAEAYLQKIINQTTALPCAPV